MTKNLANRRALLSLLFAAAGTASCGGGGSDVSEAVAAPPAAPVAAPLPPAIGGDPTFSSSCSNVPKQTASGPFSLQAGDCFASYRITDAELTAYRADFRTAPVRAQLLAAVAASFKNRIDVVIVLLDADASQQGSLPFGVNYPAQICSVHNTTCPRFARLGNVWFPARDYLKSGPSLHELLHGFHNQMASNDSAQFIIPTTVPGHWGYSSAGGQLGGWERSTLQSLGGGSYQAKGPAVPAGFVQPAGFGSNANGGNGVPYSNLELWTMGLIADAELQAVDVAQAPVATSTGKFTATSIQTYAPDNIVARVLPAGRPRTDTPRAFRGLVVLATTRPSIDAATVAQVNADIEQFSMRSAATTWSGLHNFWTATGQRASIHLATASELALP